eukprot:COSAG02_NODE_63370_length_263_cov_0.810976_1_plen_79_part_10
MLSARGAQRAASLGGRRCFSAAPSLQGNISKIMGYVSGGTPQPPLTEPHGDMGMAIDLPAALPDPVVTTLPNGVRIATQ